ncbi:hypothetical protein OFB70_32645, partial [Escherichia coli]|nr:hypothetical protein [Escherichia coli]
KSETVLFICLETAVEELSHDLETDSAAELTLDTIAAPVVWRASDKVVSALDQAFLTSLNVTSFVAPVITCVDAAAP